MGRNDSHYVRPVRQCLGRQSRGRGGSLRGPHPFGRLSVDPPAQFFEPFPSDRPLCHWHCRYFARLMHPHSSGSLQRYFLGFGRRFTWTSNLTVPPGHQMTFQDALRVSAENMTLKIMLPSWTMKLTERTRKINLAFNEVEVPVSTRYMLCPPRLTYWTAIYGRND